MRLVPELGIREELLDVGHGEGALGQHVARGQGHLEARPSGANLCCVHFHCIALGACVCLFVPSPCKICEGRIYQNAI